MNEDSVEPVLVVHGIGVRDQQGFNAQVQQLADALGPRYKLIPVHWGGLAASSLHLAKITAAKPTVRRKPKVQKTAETGNWWDWVLTEVGKGLEDGMQTAGGELRGQLRAGVSSNLVPYLGDILVYQGMRDQFHQTVRSYIPGGYGTIDRPLKAIGHSLAG